MTVRTTQSSLLLNASTCKMLLHIAHAPYHLRNQRFNPLALFGISATQAHALTHSLTHPFIHSITCITTFGATRRARSDFASLSPTLITSVHVSALHQPLFA
eukprot:m.69959 g.69959  ORF g.69959 m.69959 type:complete len:102 (-) comp12244_c0_seq1:461-766(-)